MRIVNLLGLALVAAIVIGLVVLVGRVFGFFRGGGFGIAGAQRRAGDTIADLLGIPTRTEAIRVDELVSAGRPRAETTQFFLIANRARELTAQDPTLSDQEAIAIARAEFSQTPTTATRTGQTPIKRTPDISVPETFAERFFRILSPN